MPAYLHAGQTTATEYGAELTLAAAILHQALLDTQSSREAIRTEAEQFWQNATAIATWADWLDVDPDHLQRAVHQRLHATKEG